MEPAVIVGNSTTVVYPRNHQSGVLAQRLSGSSFRLSTMLLRLPWLAASHSTVTPLAFY